MAAKKTVTTDYTADSMRELTGLEPIRQNPSQYVGPTAAISVKHLKSNTPEDEILTGGGLHLFVETLSNSSDEATNYGSDGKPFANTIDVILSKDQKITVKDNGRGVPPDINKVTGKTGIEMCWLTMNSGGKFKDKAVKSSKHQNYSSSAGLHGVGSACVAALSDYLRICVYRDGFEYCMEAHNGIPGAFDEKGNFTKNDGKKPVVVKKKDSRPAKEKKRFPHGTYVTWHPDPLSWGGTDIPLAEVYAHVVAQSYMAPECTYTIEDEIQDRTTVYHHPGGINDMVAEKTEKLGNISPVVSFDVPSSYSKKVTIEDEDGNQITQDVTYDCSVRGALRWTSNGNMDIEGYANGVHCNGKHIEGLRRGLSRGVGDWVTKDSGIMKKSDPSPTIEDITDGLIGVVEVRLEEQCYFTSQTKETLNNPEVLSCVSNTVKEQITQWLTIKKNSTVAKKVGKSIMESARLRHKQKMERETAKEIKEKLGSLSSKPRKLYDCKYSGPGTELLICEGDSAKGTILKARDAKWQAILPIRGVSANIYDMSDKELVKNAEFMDIINSMSAGYGESFDYENRKFDRIGIYTDADEDGNYIRSQLLAFIYLKFPGMIENGKVFAGCPPLYSNKFVKGPRKGEIVYIPNEAAQTKFLNNYVKSGGSIKDLNVARSKGLGEMNDDEFLDCLSPKTRRIRQIVCDDAVEAQDKLRLLFAKDKATVPERRKWIDNNFIIILD